MPNWLKSLLASYLDNPAIKAKIMAWLRWAAAAAGTAVFTLTVQFITAHLAFIEQGYAVAIATTLAGAVSSMVLLAGSAAYNVIDPDTVNARIQIAAATGSTALVNDKPTVQAVKVAAKSGTPEALSQVLANLKAGTE